MALGGACVSVGAGGATVVGGGALVGSIQPDIRVNNTIIAIRAFERRVILASSSGRHGADKVVRDVVVGGFPQKRIIPGFVYLTLDQLFKWLVTQNLQLGESWQPLQLANDFIMISRSHNTGAAFGIFPLASPFILALSLVTVVVFIIMYPRLPIDALWSRIGLSMIVGGALSNALDRIRMGYVVDYVHVRLSPSLANISNLADHVITVGVVIFLLDQWRIERQEMQASDTIEPDPQPHEEIESRVDLAGSN